MSVCLAVRVGPDDEMTRFSRVFKVKQESSGVRRADRSQQQRSSSIITSSSSLFHRSNTKNNKIGTSKFFGSSHYYSIILWSLMKVLARDNRRLWRASIPKERVLTFYRAIVFAQTALSFHLYGNGITYRSRNALDTPSSLFLASEEHKDVILSNTPFGGTTELWLDLRPTAIHPKAAMNQLESQLGTNSFVNRIVISENVFQNLVDYSDMYLMANQILYHNKMNDELFFSTGRGLSFPFGRFHPSPPDSTLVVEDPIQAIELIATGKWLLLGNDDNDTDEDRETLKMNAVGDFLDIASTTASSLGTWYSSDETSGLVLPKSTKGRVMNIDSQSSDDHNVGGVAVKCSTKSAVMKLASYLHFAKLGATTLISDSGIIVQRTANTTSQICTAAVLPFEVDVWEAALLVFGAQGLAEIEQ
jgi:hypothetical protein